MKTHWKLQRNLKKHNQKNPTTTPKSTKPIKMSSLNTLLEAARFLELQEQQQHNHHRATVEAALATIRPLTTTASSCTPSGAQTITITQTKPITATTNNHVVISSSNLLQGQITLATPVIKKEVVTPPASIAPSHPRRILNNSFDIMNPLIIDEASGETKRKQPPLVFRAGTREVHNKLEKNRRAQLKECFDMLKRQVPTMEHEKKSSNLTILHEATKFIRLLKLKATEMDEELERLAREKIVHKQRIAVLKKDVQARFPKVDFKKLLPEDEGPAATSTTSSEVSTSTITDHLSDTTTNTSPVGQAHANGCEKVAIPILAKPPAIPVVTQAVATNAIKDVSQPVQTAALSMLPMSYPVNQGVVIQKVALVPTKGLSDLPLVSTHFITTPQQINGKVVPLAQYLVKPVVVVSTASPRTS